MATGTFIRDLGYFAIRNGIKVPFSNYLLNIDCKIRLKKLLSDLNINILLDVGANKGQYAQSMRRIGFDGLIFSFEPIREDFEMLIELSRDDPMWRVFNVALGDRIESRTLNVIRTGESDTVFSSFYDLRDPTMNPSTTIKTQNILMKYQDRLNVEVKRLDLYLDEIVEHVPKPRIFLKVDTQGTDIDVIRGLGEVSNYVFGLQSELSVIPIYVGQPLYDELLKLYHSMGFKLMDMNAISRSEQGCVVEYDCIMAKF